MLQSYLAIGETVDGLISDSQVDWRVERRARLAAGNVLDALAPTNFPWSNPEVLKEAINTGGGNLVRGTRRLVNDLSKPPRLPATVDTSKFEVGGNLAVTPGSVVLRTEVFELIHYKPSTDQVREVPLLFVPPTINKYYILDISPGRSMIEHYVAQGQQVFAISWRNPDQAQGHFDLDTYADAVAEARDAAASIAAHPQVNLAAACSGGIITAGLLGHLAASGRLGEVASLTLMVCALDNDTEGTMSALASRDVAAAAVAESARKGYLDGQALAGVFTWLRPNDLVWNYVVNNYLLGKDPPAFDILYWNQDTVRLAAGLHRDFIQIGLDNAFVHPDALDGSRRPGRPGSGRHRHIFRRGLDRSHRALGERVQRSAAVRRPAPVRAFEERSHPVARQPAESGQPLLLPGGRRAPGGARDVLRAGADACGQLVVGLGRMAGRARGRTQERTQGARQLCPQAPGEGARDICPRQLRALSRSSPIPIPTRTPRSTCRRCLRSAGGATTCERRAGRSSSPGFSSTLSFAGSACRAGTGAR